MARVAWAEVAVPVVMAEMEGRLSDFVRVEAQTVQPVIKDPLEPREKLEAMESLGRLGLISLRLPRSNSKLGFTYNDFTYNIMPQRAR